MKKLLFSIVVLNVIQLVAENKETDSYNSYIKYGLSGTSFFAGCALLRYGYKKLDWVAGMIVNHKPRLFHVMDNYESLVEKHGRPYVLEQFKKDAIPLVKVYSNIFLFNTLTASLFGFSFYMFKPDPFMEK